MVNFEECKRKFNRISKGNENEGYTDWKKWVCQEVKDYNEEKMENLIKRYEIRLKMIKEDDGVRFFAIMSQIVTIFAVMIPFVANVIMTVLDINIGAYNFEGDVELMQEFADVVNETMQQMARYVIIFVVVYLSGLGIAVIASKYLDMQIYSSRNKTKIYYEELLIILKENLEEKKQSTSKDKE